MNSIAVAATAVLGFLAALVVLVLVTLAVGGQAAVGALVSAVTAPRHVRPAHRVRCRDNR